jgi:hypothetical protein
MFVRRKDAEEWALDIERRIDRRKPATSRARDAKLFGDLIALHRLDLEEVGKKIGRSNDASLTFLDARLEHLRLGELDRERLIRFGKERAQEGAGHDLPGPAPRTTDQSSLNAPNCDSWARRD